MTSAYDALAELNPFRYRGYVWDAETGLYYVSSRYYNSVIRRFISADVLVSTGQGILGNNMYAYCRNNPVCRKDIAGTTDVEIFEPDTNLLDDDELIAGGKMASANKNAVYSEPHGNSQFSTRTQHGYTKVPSDKSAGAFNYTTKVIDQMNVSSDLFHTFPTLVDTCVDVNSYYPLTGGDGGSYRYYAVLGSLNNIYGYFEYIISPDGLCNHRFFRRIFDE